MGAAGRLFTTEGCESGLAEDFRSGVVARIELPTVRFQRRRWLDAGLTGCGRAGLMRRRPAMRCWARWSNGPIPVGWC